ncbi:MAG: 4-(cytidine 5'-diphospho)-2-C-methyl-D-erythritol kinase [Gammaproteobacteria bacterium]|nr:4-(cytidine 5'-diphospho)-2-C-methyl-D-erythritol kinase [Gammaproteobacteria bacterium]
MLRELELAAPAKLNLMLHITGRRADGYHLLETVFQFVELADRVAISLRKDGVIRRLGDSPVPAADDLALRAARLLARHADVALGADIRVDKRIPIGGGLGGGSSDAASCLLALNRLWQLGMDQRQLAAIGLELGADVPVFVMGNAAWASGVGEVLEPVDLPCPWYLVIDPGISVSTARVFAAPELTRNCDPSTIRGFLQGTGKNVCEPVARELYPEVGSALDWLREHGDARLSGTGGCIFAAFDSHARAESVKSRVPRRWQAIVTRGSNRSPAHRELEQLQD